VHNEPGECVANSEKSMALFDAVVIGGGPAGASCAVWLARLGFTVTLLDADDGVGGLCRRNPFRDDWNVSLPGMTGPQVAANLALSLQQAGVPVQLQCPVSSVQHQNGCFLIRGPALPHPLSARHVVIATGVRARGLPGVAPDHPPQGVLLGPGEAVVAQSFAGKRVAVLGGGDNAFENALYALDHGAAQVEIFARTVRAQAQFVQRFPAHQVHVGICQVDTGALQVDGQSFDLIMVFYGWEPCAPFADDLGLQRTDKGFLATDPKTAQTSCPGVFAVGEVAQRQHPCVVTAMADGVAAAKAIQARLESAASGN
jgi:thioredoxin reductase